MAAIDRLREGYTENGYVKDGQECIPAYFNITDHICRIGGSVCPDDQSGDSGCG